MLEKAWSILCFLPRLILQSIRMARKHEAALQKLARAVKDKDEALSPDKEETEPNGGVNMEAVLRPRKNTTREIRRLWRDEAVLELLKNLGGRALSTNLNVAAQKFGWRFRVRTHLRRLESYGLVKSGVARGAGGVAIINWRIVEAGV